MAGSALSPWKLSLKHLQQLTDDPGDKEAPDAGLMAVATIHANSCNMPMAAQTVRKLVLDIKWPLHACTAVARAAMQQSKTAAAFVGVDALQTFFDKCSAHLQAAAAAAAAAGLSGTAAPPNSSLRRSVLQQVEASGLLHQLPALMIAAAVELSVQAKDGSFLQYGRVRAMSPSAHGFYSCVIREHAKQLLRLHDSLCRLLTRKGGSPPSGMAAVDAAVLQLALAVMRNLSAEVQAHMQQGAASHASPFDMQSLMVVAFWSVAMLDGTGSIAAALQQSQQQPEAEQQLLAPQLVPCLVLQLTITALALEMKGTNLEATEPEGEHLLSCTCGSSSSNLDRPGRQGSSSAGQRQQQQLQQQQQSQAPHAPSLTPPGVIPSDRCPCCVDKVVQTWRLACERHASLTPCHHKLFGLLGVDARAVLWAAAANRWRCTGGSMYGYYLSLYSDYVDRVMLMSDQQLCAAMTPQRQQLEQSLHLLLPVVLLHQVAALPPDHSSFVELCAVLGGSSWHALGPWGRLLLTAADTGSDSQCDAPAAELGELLHLLQLLAAGLQQQVIQQEPGSAAAAASAAAGAHPAGAAAAAAGQDEAEALDDLQVGWVSLAGCLATLLSPSIWGEEVPGPALGAQEQLMQGAPAQGTGRGTCAEAQQPELQWGLFAVAGLPEQAVGVMRVFEAFVRCRGAAAVVPGQPLPERLRAALPELLQLCCGRDWLDFNGTAGLQQQQLYGGPLAALARASGPGSAAQRQLQAMLTSVVKLVHMEDGSDGLAGATAAAAATCAAVLLQDGGAAAASVAAAAPSAAEGSCGLSAQGMVFLGLEEPSPPAVPCDALQQLPWAVLLGRSLLILGQALVQDIPKLVQAQQEGGGQLTWGQACSQAVNGSSSPNKWPSCFAASMCLHLGLEGYGQLYSCIGVLLGWLGDPAVDARLAAAGYGPQYDDVLQQLVELQVARQAAADSSDQAALSELVQHMQAAGHALACLAVPSCCNNPSCCVMAGGTELQLVSGKGCICAGCRTARYCSRSCQRTHWKRHKPVCQALAAAQGGPSAVDNSGG